MEQNSCPGTITGATPVGENEVLIWSDEFETSGNPCNDNWLYDIGNGSGGWGNNESQYYTRENAIVQDNVLKIKAKKETYRGYSYTSSRMKTQNKFSFTYGRVEVRAKLPSGGGTWPGIWMLGDDITTVGWPGCGEIDIMEHRGNNQGVTSSAIHMAAGYGNTPFVHERDRVSDVSTNFHTYGIDWTKDKIDFTVDGFVHYTYSPANKTNSNWPFNKPQFIILNVAMGGSLGGAIDPAFAESSMEIDYVRVYQ
ncbi:glycoside hydrolase family 16 protein [uncultured Polaribacter sp.]|uniref:glycoside hydrolase family 16 protein n=1 Tax=uncultured Polaribacter sp. TaxID=174711 RepID=UPI0032B30AA4